MSAIDKYQLHLDYKPNIYQQLADLNHKKGYFKKAFDMLQESKKLAEKQFGSREANSREILEIKDEFRKLKQSDDKLLQQQAYERFSTEKRIDRLRMIALACI